MWFETVQILGLLRVFWCFFLWHVAQTHCKYQCKRHCYDFLCLPVEMAVEAKWFVNCSTKWHQVARPTPMSEPTTMMQAKTSDVQHTCCILKKSEMFVLLSFHAFHAYCLSNFLSDFRLTFTHEAKWCLAREIIQRSKEYVLFRSGRFACCLDNDHHRHHHHHHQNHAISNYDDAEVSFGRAPTCRCCGNQLSPSFNVVLHGWS